MTEIVTTDPNVKPTVADFLGVITHGQIERAWLAAVPDIEHSPPGYWYGMRFPEFDKRDRGDCNLYYSLGLIGMGPRKLDQWVGGTLIALDDVGEKSGAARDIRATLGDPTFVVQTSKGSQQWGYVLSEQITDITRMGRLQRALTLRFYPKMKDPGHERVIQYLRLPAGVNNKPSRLAENNGYPQRVRLVEWRPELRLDPMDAEMALGDAWDMTENMSMSASGLSGPATEEAARAYLGTDGLLAGLDMAGMVDWGRLNNGYVGVRCPWESEHTGVHDDRAGYNPDSKHFSCFHGSHGPKGPHDLDDWLRANVGAPYIHMRQEMTRKAFKDAPFEHRPHDPDAPPPAPRMPLVPIAKNPAGTPLPARRSVCGHLARGEVTYRIGAPAIGKSALALAYACAFVYERPDIIGESVISRPGDVVIVSNEDNADDYRKRLIGLQLKHGLLDTAPEWEIAVTPTQNFSVVTKEDRYSPVTLSDDMAWLVQAWADQGLKPAVVIIDTQAATFRGISENDNADMGTAMALLTNWARDNGVAVEVLHHAPKAQGRDGGGGDLATARGAGAAGASVRNAVTMNALPPAIKAKLPGDEGEYWISELGAKANHALLRGKKWWYRDSARVSVIDPDTGQPDQQSVPVYLFRPAGPPVIFDPNDPAVIFQVVAAVAEAEREDNPFRVVKGRTDKFLPDHLAEAHPTWEHTDAAAAIKSAFDRKLIEQVEWRNPATRRHTGVWSATREGLAMLDAGIGTAAQDTGE